MFTGIYVAIIHYMSAAFQNCHGYICGYIQSEFVGNFGGSYGFGLFAFCDLLLLFRIYPVLYKYVLQFFGKRS